MNNVFKDFLKEVAPYVITVGSYARFEENDYSDIDFYIRRRPQEDIDKEMEKNYGVAEETYINIIMDLIKKYNLEFSSVIISHVAVEVQPGIPQMLEFSSSYTIPKDNNVFVREIHGIKFLCCIDNKNVRPEDQYEYMDFVDREFTNIHPLPSYEEYISNKDYFIEKSK